MRREDGEKMKEFRDVFYWRGKNSAPVLGFSTSESETRPRLPEVVRGNSEDESTLGALAERHNCLSD